MERATRAARKRRVVKVDLIIMMKVEDENGYVLQYVEVRLSGFFLLVVKVCGGWGCQGKSGVGERTVWRWVDDKVSVEKKKKKKKKRKRRAEGF